jgi:queuine tRNA-ribosyltransferase
MDIQRTIGADIIMAFDECAPGDADYNYARKSLDLTLRWLERCARRFGETDPKYGFEQSLFPIVQGAAFTDLRQASAREVQNYGADGYAIGGLAVGEPESVMYEMIEVVNALLPADKPRYLMGVGTPVNLLEAIDRGVDMFDCVMPTRNGRNGMLFTREGIINLRNNKWIHDHSPVDPEGTSFVDRDYSRAYLRHLTISKEMLGAQIASQHNLAFYMWLMAEARRQIEQNSFKSWKEQMVLHLNQRL